jgi:hypothetical protein
MIAGYYRKMQEPVYRIKEWYNQCILLVVYTTSNMYGTNIKICIHIFILILFPIHRHGHFTKASVVLHTGKDNDANFTSFPSRLLK